MEETNPIPSLTQEQVDRIMRNKLGGEDFKILSYDLEMLGDWIGLTGDHAILKINIKPEENSKKKKTNYIFFVKLYPRIQSIIDFIEGNGCFRKEIFIYNLFESILREEINILSECVSQCYLSINEKFLIFDNLIEEGYSSIKKYEIFDYDTIKIVLESLSKLHASTILYEEKKSCRLIDIYKDELEETYYNDNDNFPNKQGIEAAIVGVLNCIKLFDFPNRLISGKDFRTVLEEVCRRVFQLAKPSKTFRNVICHGDIWATNIVIKYEDSKPVKCKLVDFQCARYVPPAQDVMSVIYLTTSREFRKKYMYNLIGIYYSNLEKIVTLGGYDMKKIIPFDEFLASCEKQKAFGLVQAATYFPLILLESKVAEAYFKNMENNKEAFFVDRSILIKEYNDKNDNYKNRIRDSLQDLKDYCDFL